MNNNTVLETSTRVTVVLEVCRTPSARKQTGYRHWLGGMGGLDKWLRKLQITSKSSQNVSAKWAEQTEGRGRKEEKRKIIGRESSRCVTGCSPATGSRQEHNFQFLNSSQQTLSFSGTSLLFLFVLFFSTPVLIARRSTLTGPPVTVKVPLCEKLTLPVLSDSNQCLRPTFTPVVSFAFFKEVRTKTPRPDNKPFVMSRKTLSFFPLVVTPSAASWLRPLRPPGFSQAPTAHQ